MTETAFRGVIWPGRRVTLPDGSEGYLTAVVGAFVTAGPTAFNRETEGKDISEVVLVGTSRSLVQALEGIDRGHAPYRLGDSSSVLTSLDHLQLGEPRESCDCNRCDQVMWPEDLEPTEAT